MLLSQTMSTSMWERKGIFLLLLLKQMCPMFVDGTAEKECVCFKWKRTSYHKLLLMQPALCNRAYVLLCVFLCVKQQQHLLQYQPVTGSASTVTERPSVYISLSLSPEDVCVNTQCVPYINSYEEAITALQNTQNIPRLQMHANTDKRKTIQRKLRTLLTLCFGEKLVTYF